tara:strand:- start:31 stop:201 length:171 start_codon:yes stop_codon:yes gene_type:complete
MASLNKMNIASCHRTSLEPIGLRVELHGIQGRIANPESDELEELVPAFHPELCHGQ